MKKKSIVYLVLAGLTLVFAFKPIFKNSDCQCDKAETEKIIKNKDFNRSPLFDDTLSPKGFYSLSASDNRILWYRDIESPEKTLFTSLWDDYAPNNYHASHLDFIKYYLGKKDIELAFQFGPNRDLWAYHIFVLKKIGCCYLATRSYFRHARFTAKKYAILGEKQVDSLYLIIAYQKTMSVDTTENFDYCGYFVDNRNNKKFYINFDKDQMLVPSKHDTSIKTMQVRPEIDKLYDFVDNKIQWTKTY